MIYEMRDTSWDEAYYTLGYFRSFNDALDCIKAASPDEPLSPYNYSEETEIIGIYRVSFGFGAEPFKVFEIKRQNIYDDETDTTKWIGSVMTDNRNIK